MHFLCKNCCLLLVVLFVLFVSCTNKIWQFQANDSMLHKVSDCMVSNQIANYSTWKINFEKLKTQLAIIPVEYAKNQPPIIAQFPDRNGNMIAFEMYQSHTMSPVLAKQFPELKSYMGNAIIDNTITIRVNINETGFHALLASTKGQWLIEPFCEGKSKNYYCCYSKSDFNSNREPFNEKR